MANDERYGDWMQLYSGKPFWPLDPRAEEIDIADIAHALSQQCRYAGHCLGFYSVAQHSVLVSRNVPLDHAVWGLLHDAAEAYLVDLPRPVKGVVQGYREAEDRVLAAVAEHFGLAFPIPEAVHLADNEALITEKRDLMAPSMKAWGLPPELQPWPDAIDPWIPSMARYLFLKAAFNLGLRGAEKALDNLD